MPSFTLTEDGARTQPRLPLFVNNDHSTIYNVVPNLSIINDENSLVPKKIILSMFRWLGQMIGNTVLSGATVFAVSFPRLMWKFLVNDHITIEDYFADCSDTAQGALQLDDFLMSDEFFCAFPNMESLSSAVPMIAATSHDELSSAPQTPTTADRAEVLRVRRESAEQALIHQYDEPLSAIRSGFNNVVPSAAVSEMRWNDLQRRVCGIEALSSDDIIQAMDLTALTPVVKTMLKEAIASMSAETRSRLLLFCTGQCRLPLPEKIKVHCGDNSAKCPSAHTCSPISLQIQEYGSTEEMMARFSVAISHAYNFGFV